MHLKPHVLLRPDAVGIGRVWLGLFRACWRVTVPLSASARQAGLGSCAKNFCATCKRRPAGRPGRLRLCLPARDGLVRLAKTQGALPSLPPAAAQACLPGSVVILGTVFAGSSGIANASSNVNVGSISTKKNRKSFRAFCSFFLLFFPR